MRELHVPVHVASGWQDMVLGLQSLQPTHRSASESHPRVGARSRFRHRNSRASRLPWHSAARCHGAPAPCDHRMAWMERNATRLE